MQLIQWNNLTWPFNTPNSHISADLADQVIHTTKVRSWSPSGGFYKNETSDHFNLVGDKAILGMQPKVAAIGSEGSW